jgi:hypothetical protein
MKYKIFGLMLVLIINFFYITAKAEEITFDIVKTVGYVGAEVQNGTTGYSEIISLWSVFQDVQGISNLSVNYIKVGGIDGRGTLILRLYPQDNPIGSISLPPNPGDPDLGEMELAQLFTGWSFQLRAEKGRLFFMEMRGQIQLNDGTKKNFKILFDGQPSEPGEPGEPGGPTEPPGPIQNVRAEVQGDNIIVRWDPDPNAEGYRVIINNSQTIDVGNNTSYTFTPVPGQPYEVEVVGYNNLGESPRTQPITVIRPEDPSVIIVQPPDINIPVPMPVYFPDVPPPPSPPPVNPYPSPGNYIPNNPDNYKPSFDPSQYMPREYNPSLDGDIERYNPPPLSIPEPVPSPEPLPSIPDPVIMPHDEPIPSQEPREVQAPIMPQEPKQQEEPITVEQPRQVDPVTVEPPRPQTGYQAQQPIQMDPPRSQTGYQVQPPRQQTGYQMQPPRQTDPVTMDPPRNQTGYQVQPPRQQTGYQVQPPRQQTGYQMQPPRQMDPVTMDPPRQIDAVIMDPPREITGYEMQPPREMDPPLTP